MLKIILSIFFRREKTETPKKKSPDNKKIFNLVNYDIYQRKLFH